MLFLFLNKPFHFSSISLYLPFKIQALEATSQIFQKFELEIPGIHFIPVWESPIQHKSFFLSISRKICTFNTKIFFLSCFAPGTDSWGEAKNKFNSHPFTAAFEQITVPYNPLQIISILRQHKTSNFTHVAVTLKLGN